MKCFCCGQFRAAPGRRICGLCIAADCLPSSHCSRPVDDTDACSSCGEPLDNGSRGISAPDHENQLCGACADEGAAERRVGVS